MNLQPVHSCVGLVVMVGVSEVDEPAELIGLALRDVRTHVDSHPKSSRLLLRIRVGGVVWDVWSRKPGIIALRNLSTGTHGETRFSDWSTVELLALDTLEELIAHEAATPLMRAEFLERIVAIVPVSALDGSPLDWFQAAMTLRGQSVKN
ncbi:hypothetical protein EKK58_05880 [Candidatus Dependentiae bacterium]|nr:MAG: hypothetical protein EKK58_05880 [Candidatus Dependentiae bacterium]